MRRANERRMSISPPCAAATGRAVAAALMALLYANRAEDGVESLWIRNEQEEAVEALRRLVEIEFSLHAKNRRVDPGCVIADATQRLTRLAARQRRGRQQQSHAEKVAQRRQVGAGENISCLVEGRLLELAKALRCAAVAPQHPLGEADSGVDVEKKHRLAADVTAHRHLHGDDLRAGGDPGDEAASRKDAPH